MARTLYFLDTRFCHGRGFRCITIHTIIYCIQYEQCEIIYCRIVNTQLEPEPNLGMQRTERIHSGYSTIWLMFHGFLFIVIGLPVTYLMLYIFPFIISYKILKLSSIAYSICSNIK